MPKVIDLLFFFSLIFFCSSERPQEKMPDKPIILMDNKVERTEIEANCYANERAKKIAEIESLMK